jgi:L-methionine (R)-S-oxide reductase
MLSDEFPEMSFVGFYDAKVGDSKKIYIGEYVSNADIFPCGEIEYGKGQCGLCASLKKVMIAHDTKKLDNYISCDEFTRSEIVLPVLHADGSYRTQLDIDSPTVGTFDEVDEKWLAEMLKVIY